MTLLKLHTLEIRVRSSNGETEEKTHTNTHQTNDTHTKRMKNRIKRIDKENYVNALHKA